MLDAMRVIVLGAGHVTATLVEALHDEHDLTVVDVDAARLAPLADRFDVRAVHGDGTTRKVLRQAGVTKADLLVACSSSEEANLVAAMLAKRMSDVTTVMRTTSTELFEAWREGEIDVDHMVSPELETANAITGVIGLPAARHTDVFAGGKVQLVEFDVPGGATDASLVGRPLRRAAIPPDSKVACLIRAGRMVAPRGDEQILPEDRVVVMASLDSARAWSRILAAEHQTIEDVVLFGAGQMGVAIATVLLEHGIRVRLVESRPERAHRVAALLPQARVFGAEALDGAFLDRLHMEQSAVVSALNDDAKNLYATVLAKVHGVRMTIALVHDPGAAQVYERGGVDVAINPREVTAEEMVRFALDPRVHQVSMLEGDRFEVLDITVRDDSPLANKPFRELPAGHSVIGAIVRDGTVTFPHSADVLKPGDRVIVFVEAQRASTAAEAL
jgi:trk system potassium uptake protein TrkA